ncbi:MAG: hypothetical protein EYC68_18075 [Chloroflexota bacterium]|nr:MAG: hypothetical protein EYC68_18075 [Chloroflexota bacterium]
MPKSNSRTRTTHAVSAEIFKQVYDSPRALPGRYRWVTRDEDVRVIEDLLGMKPQTIGAPLWVSGESKHCPKCGRETNWLDIVASALAQVHSKELLARVILGEQKFVNTEAPNAIVDLYCYDCRMPIRDLRSFKCHNWAYAKPALLNVLKRIEAKAK